MIGQTNKQTEIKNLYTYKLGNPALPTVFIIYPNVYPHLVDFTGKLNFRTHSTLNLKTKLKTFPWFSQVPQSIFEANRLKGSRVMIEQTNIQRDITTLYI